MITHLEPDILECEVKWALESITTNKVSGGDGIPVELFQILKDDTVKMLQVKKLTSAFYDGQCVLSNVMQIYVHACVFGGGRKEKRFS